jgi:23S rRNA pseudouridine1911/1915/1917 synthase
MGRPHAAVSDAPHPARAPGVNWTIAAPDAGVRLDKFLAGGERLGSRSRAAAALERGHVFLNGREASLADAARLLTPGDVVRIWRDRPGSARVLHTARRSGPLDILYEDASLLVLNKPPGLLSVPLERKAQASSVYDQLETYFRSHGKRKPFVVHRIDRDTSGLVLFAKDARAQAALKAQFKSRQPHREYRAVVYGCPDPASGTWRDYLVWDSKALMQKAASARHAGAMEAISEYRVIETFERASVLDVRLQTGKRNQIRIQAALHGHPLVGERRYVGEGAPPPIDFARQALHAYQLGFRHPVDGREMRFEAPLPADLLELLGRLRRRT